MKKITLISLLFLLICFIANGSTQWVINEILADPASDISGDANGDGTRDAGEDEFVELVNNTGADVDISGWTLSDDTSIRHTFPAGTVIPDKCAVVVFGGGTPTGNFGNATVHTASSGSVSLRNSGDTVTLNNGTSDVVSYTYGSAGGDNQSLTRDPDITGTDPLIKHSAATGSGGSLFSPGTKIDGSNFSGCDVSEAAPSVNSTSPSNGETDIAIDVDIVVNFSEDVTITGSWYSINGSISGAHTATVSGGPQNYTLNPDTDFSNSETVTVTIFAASVTDNDTDDPPDNMTSDYTFSFTIEPAAGSWVINEIHADPDASNGDANGDGVVNTSQDEFVEIVNISGAAVDISGWTLSDGISIRHTFPPTTIISDQCAVLIFSGGTPTGSFGSVIVQTASSGQLSLNNSGDTVTLNNGTSDVASCVYGSEGGDNQSLTRDPDISGTDPLVKHSAAAGSGGALFSPGTKIDGTNFSGCSVSIAPTVTTDATSAVGTTNATLNGTVNANNASTTVTFEYGETTAYGMTVTANQSPVTGSTNTAVSKTITGLTNGVTYHYRAVGQNANGTTYGADMTFTTGSATDADGDGIPDSKETGDRDGDTITDKDDYDPTGWIYLETNGYIIPGGTIQVTGPGAVNIIHNGSTGYYQWTVSVAGTYIMTYTPPTGYLASTTCLPQTGSYDPTTTPDPNVIGTGSRNGTTDYLTDWDCSNNPFYFSFILESGDPIIINNNIPLQQQPTNIVLTSFHAEVGQDGILINWQTETEPNNAGFNIFRSQQENSDYSKINENMIPAQGNAITGANYSYSDNPENAGTYYYKLQAISLTGDSSLYGPVSAALTSVDIKKFTVPDNYSLSQNYPNPFNPETTIEFGLPKAGFVEIAIFDINGKLVRTLISGQQRAGNHWVKWDGRDASGLQVSSGVYLYQLKAANLIKTGVAFTQTNKMILMK